ncbi:MAG TPA: hypothetical protein VFZ53_13975 [Polyangiaceae bacterium]
MTREAAVSPLARPLAVTLYFACHAAAAWLLALPTTAVVASTGLGRFPEGDRLLFEPGGLVLAEITRVLAPALPAHVASSLGAAVLLGGLLLVPHAALLVSLARAERETLAATFARAFSHLPALIALSGLAVLAQTTLMIATFSVARALRDAMSSATTRSADLAWLAAVSLGVIASLAVGIVRDLGRAAVVRDDLDSKAALFAGLSSFGRAPGRALSRWLVPALASFSLVAVGAVVTGMLDVSRPGAWRLALVTLTHQTVAFALCVCRAYWLRASLDLARDER